MYLLGNALGCLVLTRRVDALHRPLRVFLALQCGLLIYSLLIVVVFGRAPLRGLGLGWFVEYWRQYGFFALGHERDFASAIRLYVPLPIVLFGPPTVLMGAAFPVLQRAVHDDPRSSGRKVGYLQAANILGCVAGTLLVGLLGLHTLGTTGSLRLLAIVGLVFAGVGVRLYGRVFIAPAAALLLLAAAMPDQDDLWRRLHGVRARALAFVEEDATGVVALTPDRRTPAQRWRLSVNGKGNSWLPYGGVHTLLGALPSVLHPAPLNVAIVGLGSGDTAWAAAARPDTRSITVFELSTLQVALLRQVARADLLPDVESLLADPRVTIVGADGRKALLAGRERYDVIEADAMYPSAAFSGNLYSVEFFEVGASRLERNGLLCTWAPTPRIRASFRQVFPHVVAVGQDVLVGSNEPIPWTPDLWLDRLRPLAGYLGEARHTLLLAALSRVRALPAGDPGEDVNRDLFPKDEFGVR